MWEHPAQRSTKLAYKADECRNLPQKEEDLLLEFECKKNDHASTLHCLETSKGGPNVRQTKSMVEEQQQTRSNGIRKDGNRSGINEHTKDNTKENTKEILLYQVMPAPNLKPTNTADSRNGQLPNAIKPTYERKQPQNSEQAQAKGKPGPQPPSPPSPPPNPPRSLLFYFPHFSLTHSLTPLQRRPSPTTGGPSGCHAGPHDVPVGFGAPANRHRMGC